ncbi:hypothetical protein ACET97_10430 [Aeromonas enteropelogenes]|uniref:hypothetical protein n=1 Tax=Aeromonas enteropelogenes TaxID=29489 RepID=UPI0038D0F026
MKPLPRGFFILIAYVFYMPFIFPATNIGNHTELETTAPLLKQLHHHQNIHGRALIIFKALNL